MHSQLLTQLIYGKFIPANNLFKTHNTNPTILCCVLSVEIGKITERNTGKPFISVFCIQIMVNIYWYNTSKKEIHLIINVNQ